MDTIRLLKPSMKYEKEILDFAEEVRKAKDRDDFAGCGGLQKCATVLEWIDKCEMYSNPETCPKGKVSSNVYLAIREKDSRLVGVIDLRHSIDHPILSVWGGHIGYSVRPSERRKGYGREMLRLVLDKARERGIDKVMISCAEGNTASERTILANGGVYEKTVFVESENESIKRYWITL